MVHPYVSAPWKCTYAEVDVAQAGLADVAELKQYYYFPHIVHTWARCIIMCQNLQPPTRSASPGVKHGQNTYTSHQNDTHTLRESTDLVAPMGSRRPSSAASTLPWWQMGNTRGHSEAI